MAESWAQMLILVRYRTTIGELPKKGQAMDESCLWSQLWAVHYQTWPLIEAGFKKERTWPRDTVVKRN